MQVQAGQVWRNADARRAPYDLRVDTVLHDFTACTYVSGQHTGQRVIVRTRRFPKHGGGNRYYVLVPSPVLDTAAVDAEQAKLALVQA